MNIAKSFWKLIGASEKFEQRWIIASNRLPFRYHPETQALERSLGGLVSALLGIHASNDVLWIGVAPDGLDPRSFKGALPQFDTMHFHPIFIEPERYSRYYNGTCNNVLWPILHYESNLVEFKREDWQAYCSVNEIFATEIIKIAKPGDVIWVHDFHLFLVGEYLRALKPELRVGFFLHTPFPSSEIFRQLSVRKEIAHALTKYNLIGFHDYSYLRHFTSTVQQVLGLQPSLMSISLGDHVTSLGVFPVSVDTKTLQEEAKRVEVKNVIEKFSRETAAEYLILGIDRLDYIKGIKLKLRAFEELLRAFPEMQGKVCLLQFAVPSRTDIPGYVELRKEVEQLVGKVNGSYGKPNYVPVQYIFSTAEHHELLALYRLADVLLVTSRRDGMNLVALEYIAAQDDNDPGVVVLSEFTGATSTLSHVVQINPWDIEGTAVKLQSALLMEHDQRVYRHTAMKQYLLHYSATDWAQSFVRALERSVVRTPIDKAQYLTQPKACAQIISDLIKKQNKKKLLLFIDNDGTLMPFVQSPREASLDEPMKVALRTLITNHDIRLVILSGRDREFLLNEFQALDVDLAAEHGAFFFDREIGNWISLIRHEQNEWFDLVRQVMEDYTARVPDSTIEEKSSGLVWHYRKSPVDFGHYQAIRLKQDLDLVLANLPVSVIFGDKVVEVKPVEANKSAFVHWYHERYSALCSEASLVAIGDDVTDEEMFQAVSARDGISLKVGTGATVAQYRISGQSQVVVVINELALAMAGMVVE